MKLAILNLTAGGFSGGYKKYLKNMLPRLAKHKKIDSILCILPNTKGVQEYIHESPVIKYSNSSTLKLRHLIHIADKKLASCIEKFSPDIIFCPVDRYIRFNRIPIVNMVRNMEPFVPNMRGDTLKERLKKIIQQRLTINSVRLADRTIAVSGYVEDYIINNFRVNKNKVAKVYHGITPSMGGEIIRPALIPKEWGNNFIFTCGSIRPARGLEDIFQALSILKDQYIGLRLVVAGDTTPGMLKYRHYLEKQLKLMGLLDRVLWIGGLNENDMRWCYKNCRLFVMTSRIEACPNIVLEAMSNGCLSVSSSNPPMPEFFKETAFYYKPQDIQSLVDSINISLSLDPSQRMTKCEEAKERASEFSWDLCAQKTVEELLVVYKNR